MTIKLSAIMATLLFIVGCQSAPYKTKYTLAVDNTSSIQPSSTHKPYSVIVSNVQTFGAGINTDMMYTRTANVMESYTKSEWLEPPAQLIKVAIANALIASNAYQDVLVSPTAIQSPYKVETTIQRMDQIFENGTSYVELSLMVRLVKTASNQLVFSKIYSAKETAETLSAEGGVVAYNRALQRLLPSIVRDLTAIKQR